MNNQAVLNNKLLHGIRACGVCRIVLILNRVCYEFLAFMQLKSTFPRSRLPGFSFYRFANPTHDVIECAFLKLGALHILQLDQGH